MIDSLLIANRGEIACRVIRTARRLGMRTIAVFSEADRGALHTRLADEALLVGPAAARESYLDMARILDAARATRASAIHPGYGFLSENAAFARACREAGIVFVGPPEDAILRMGSKSEARQLMAAAGVPVLPGYDGDDQSAARLEREARSLGFPLLIKPTAGGGGKGMRIVREAADFAEALAGARREAAKSFGDERVLLERFVDKGRHVEIQVFADSFGAAVHLFERDCSLQRRHQKVIEEAPAPGIGERTRDAMGAAAVAAARAVAYQGAGTVEFLYDGRDFYFLEMNTRLQVEHPVTEMITGLDLVEWQLRVAAGERLPLAQEDIRCSGHAVEARLYAEDPERGFLPSTGRLHRLRFPETLPNVRVDSGVREGDAVSVHYDPMIAKVIAWGQDRGSAIDLLRSALEKTEVDGVRCNARYLWEILGAEAVRAGDVSTRLLEQSLQPVGETPAEREDAWLLAAAARLGPSQDVPTEPASPWSIPGGFRLNGDPVVRFSLRIDEDRRSLSLRAAADGVWAVKSGGLDRELWLASGRGGDLVGTIDHFPVSAYVEVTPASTVVRRQCLRFEVQEDDGATHHASAEHEGHLKAPMPGHVLDVRATTGARVKAGEVLVVLEAMKMEHSLAAPWDGTVLSVDVKQGDRVEEGAELIVLEPVGDAPLRHAAAQE
ncbi:MAG: acetyl/propionyl/methylcrotonyl-CoA carboxylase subunit alpha [Steroidobacteraceae bacterium]|nr:acetyl/propionyl/methylcrotonyl-CoA carboxylase subunit alpha [Steroidobacteraceae bacterium]